MNFRQALRTTAHAARVNLLPGLLLQAFLAIFLLLYFYHPGTRDFLAQVAALKKASGFAFAFVCYAITAAILPEILRIIFFQKGRATRKNAWFIFTGILFWGPNGILVDILYHCQVQWFGAGADWQTIALKMVVDQFLFSALLNTPAIVTYFAWRDRGFRLAALRELVRPHNLFSRVFPVQVAGWCIWIPSVCVIYRMPPELQLPVAVLVQVFWVLVLTLINTDEPQPEEAL